MKNKNDDKFINRSNERSAIEKRIAIKQKKLDILLKHNTLKQQPEIKRLTLEIKELEEERRGLYLKKESTFKSSENGVVEEVRVNKKTIRRRRQK